MPSSTASTVRASSPRRSSLRRTRTSAACTAHGSPARPRRCSSTISPTLQRADDPRPRSRRARARTRARAGTRASSPRTGGRRCGRSPTSAPAGGRAGARQRAAAAGAARVALAVRAGEIDRLLPALADHLQVDLQHLGGIGQLVPLHPAAPDVGEKARTRLQGGPARRAADQVDLHVGRVGAIHQRPPEIDVEVAVRDRVATRPRAGLLEQQEPARIRGRGGEILTEALAEH